MKVTRFTAKNNEEWRVERAKSIGASSIGTLVGENPYQTPMELAEKMKAELQGHFDYTQNLAMLRGHAYEDGVAQLFAWSTGKQLIKASSAEYLLRRDDLPFMHCSPDRTYWIDPDGNKIGDKGERNKGILECKTTRRPVDADEPPLAWQFQLQMQLGIGGYREGYLAWDVLSQADGFGYHRYEFNAEVFDLLTDICRDFWEECIIGDKVPDPVAVRDVVKRWPSSVEGKTREVDAEAHSLWMQLKAKRDAIKEVQAEADELEDKLKLLFEDDEALTFNGDILATYRSTAGRTTIDSKKLKEKFPQAYAECSKVGAGGRTFRLK
jgi:putative phage-type endonuclease